MNDIKNREDILLIMRKFYDKLLADDSINFFFTKVTSVDQHLEAHFEILATFWEQSLFLKGGYFNNMISIHKEVHDKHAFTKEIANPRIDFSIALTEDSIIYSISDNGKGLNGQTYHDVISKSTSKGLKITLAQLAKYFPDKHALTVSENDKGGVSWVVTVQC